MSGFEIETLQERVHGMTEDQQRTVAEALPDEILWEAVYGRFLYLQGRVATISQIMNSGGRKEEAYSDQM